MRVLCQSLLVPLLIFGLLLPKVTGLMLHLHPNILTTVICTGSELVIIHLGPDGAPVEVTETDHAPCTLADPEAVAADRLAEWTAAPRSYRHAFVQITRVVPDEAQLGLLPDLRGPPVST